MSFCTRTISISIMIVKYRIAINALFLYFKLCISVMLDCLSCSSHPRGLSTLMLWVRLPPMRGVLDTTLCDKVCQWFATGRWFSLCTQVFSTNKTDCHNITEILSKVALNIINQIKPSSNQYNNVCISAISMIGTVLQTIHHSGKRVPLDRGVGILNVNTQQRWLPHGTKSHSARWVI